MSNIIMILTWMICGILSVYLKRKFLNIKNDDFLFFLLGYFSIAAIILLLIEKLFKKKEKQNEEIIIENDITEEEMEKLEKNVFLKGREILKKSLQNAGTYGNIDYWSDSSKKLSSSIENFLIMTEPLIENDDNASMNINQYVVIYPSESGWKKIREIIVNKYCDFHDLDIEEYIMNRTYDCGYKEQLWCIMKDFGDLFHNGSTYLENSTMKIVK